MDFFSAFGFTMDVYGFSNELRNKLKNVDSDWNQFISAIKKHVKKVCETYRKFIEMSPDHTNIIFSKEYEKSLIETVVFCMENNNEFVLSMVQIGRAHV